MFEELLDRTMLAIGIYRSPSVRAPRSARRSANRAPPDARPPTAPPQPATEAQDGAPLPYVYTCPPPNAVLRVDDHIFAIAPSDNPHPSFD